MPIKTQVTLRTAVVLPFLMIFLFTIGVIVLVQKNSYEEMVNDISAKQLTSFTSNVNQSLTSFLQEPFNAALSLSHNIEFNHLYKPNDLSNIQSYLLKSFTQLYYSIPQLDVISFGSEAANYVGLRKESNAGYSLMLQDSRTNDQLVIYRGREVTSDIRSVISNYDPRIRPWYLPIVKNKKPSWSPIYSNADERQEITLSALSPTFDNGEFIGVFVADIKIDTFNAFLKALKEKTNASVYIMDKDQRLVAHSSDGSVLSWGTDRTEKGVRLFAAEGTNPIIKRHAQYVNEHQLTESNSVHHFDFNLNGERYFSKITPYTDAYGITWYIGMSIPEQDLLGKLPQSQKDSWVIGLIVSLCGLSLGLVAFNNITRPITSTAAAAKHLAKGDWNSKMPQPGHIYETNLLVFAFNEMANNLKASFTALQTQLTYDSLTQLYSREGLIEASETLNSNVGGCLLLIGIDRFRDINDSLGHHKGDQLLLIASSRLKTSLPEDYLMARTGGDEFAIYVPSVADDQEVSLLANRLLQVFASPFSIESDNVVIKISIGIVNTSPDKDMTLWLRNSSIALSRAKQDNTRISLYSPEMADATRNRTKMIARITAAIENDEFLPFYQPIIDLATGETIGAEALARWISNQGIISPLDFIPLAEDSGLIGDIGRQIMYKSCRDTASAIESGKWAKDFVIHVNLSVDQLTKDDFINDVEQILEATRLPAKNLTLEVTESRIADNDPSIIEKMLALKALGISIAIDDFGTGYSSLAYLHKLPFDCLKIDRSFVNKLTQDNLDTSIVAAIVNITKGFKVNLVAEGVETQQQAALLSQLQCPQAQGFLYSRPVPFEEWPTDLVNMK